jgi:hypothetical protein
MTANASFINLDVTRQRPRVIRRKEINYGGTHIHCPGCSVRLVEHLERAGFVVMKRPADVGAAALGRGFKS